MLDSVCQGFGDNLVNDIAQTNGPEITGGFGRGNFMDNCNVGIIDFLEQPTRVKKG